VKDGKFTLVENNLEATQTIIDDSMTRFKIVTTPTKDLENKKSVEMPIATVLEDSPPKIISQESIRKDSP